MAKITHRHICANCVAQGQILNHPEKDCQFSKKQFSKKRASGCSVLNSDLSSSKHEEQSHDCVVKSVLKPETFFGKVVTSYHDVDRGKVPKNVVADDSQRHPGQGHSHEVRTRLFYNSSFDKRQLQGLLARGNRKTNLKNCNDKNTLSKCKNVTRVPRSAKTCESQCQMNAQVHNDVVSECPRNTHVEHILTGARNTSHHNLNKYCRSYHTR